MRSALTISLLVAVASVASGQSRPLAIVNGQIIDMHSERPYRATILIHGGRIERVAPPNAAVPSGFDTLDASGSWIIPGLWDMHVHVWDRALLFPIYVARGITGMRDMGSTLSKWLAWRDSVSAGSLDGPHAIVSGVIVDGIAPFSTFFTTAASPDTGRAVVRDLKRRGADFIKVYDRLSRDTYLAIADEAKAPHMPIPGHLPPAVTVRDAMRAGQRSIEHLGGLALDCASASDSLRRAAVAALDSVRALDFGEGQHP